MPKAPPLPFSWNTKPSGPLLGVRVVDLTRLYPGPLATKTLADLGADVVKIEHPQKQDPMRFYPPFIGKDSAGYLAMNQAKQKLSLDISSDPGRTSFLELVATADILIEGFRPGVMAQWQLDYESVKKVNAKLIYVSLTGYGQKGPYVKEAGHDLNYIGYAGILEATGTQETGPIPPGVQIADVAGGAYMAVIGSLSALWARERTGKGQFVDISMLDAVLPLMTLQLAQHWAMSPSPKRGNLFLSGATACYGVYECKDKRFVALGALEPKFWRGFCQLVNRPDWIPLQMAQGTQREHLVQALKEVFRQRSRNEWVALGKDRDICLTPVSEFDEVTQDPQLKARQMFSESHDAEGNLIRTINTPLKFSETPIHQDE